jgi:NADH dehydrogenase
MKGRGAKFYTHRITNLKSQIMKLFITGGNGFLGQGIASAGISAGYQARCMVRRDRTKPIVEGAERFVVDYANVGRLAQGMQGCSAVFNAVGIIREFPAKGATFQKAHIDFTRDLISACKEASIRRYLHISVLGVDSDLKIPYNTTKLESERMVRESGLDWTIFRPSLIFGPGDRFAVEFAEWIKKELPIPLIGSGKYLLSPVSRQDLCRGMINLIEDKRSIGKTYHIGGPEILSYFDILKIIEKTAGKRMRLLRLPSALLIAIASLLGRFACFPATADMIRQLIKGNYTSDREFWKDTGITPIKFEEGIYW